jgi:squalene-hopene/tetraprenyl-beta-curcumene cyclase
MSNTQFMIQAMHDAGVDYDDPALQRAIAFLEKSHNRPRNDFYPEGALNKDGGFIYSSSINSDLIGVPESKANPKEMDEALEGKPVSGLRSYGSMTYAGFKSYIFANLDRDDPRVQTALAWLKDNYDLDQNPGMPEPIHLHGLYYYYLAQARALEAWGEPELIVADPGQATVIVPKDMVFQDAQQILAQITEEGFGQVNLKATDETDVQIYRNEKPVRWALMLIAKLDELQQSDGSWVNEADRWMEGNPDLVTAYALLALQAAERSME